MLTVNQYAHGKPEHDINTVSLPAQNLRQGDDATVAAVHLDASSQKLEKIHNGDTALVLFASGDEWHGSIDPTVERRLVRKIDLMILPFLAVCYAFYYVCRQLHSLGARPPADSSPDRQDNALLRRHIWHHGRSGSQGNRVFLALQHILFWLLGLGLPDQLSHAEVPRRKVSGREHLPLGLLSHAARCVV